MPAVLGYWDLRGLGASIRYLLAYAGVEYEEKLYKCGPPPTFDRSQWLSEKFTLGLDFPNLPYYIDDDVKLTQSSVILRYLARKYDLDGKTEKERVKAELASSQVFDYHMEYARIVYSPDFPKLKEDYLKVLPEKLKALSSFLGTRKFAAAEYVTYADFQLFEYLEGQSFLVEGLLKDYPVLDDYHKRILALEPIDKYIKSDKYIKFPFNGAPAYFGGAYSDQLLKQ